MQYTFIILSYISTYDDKDAHTFAIVNQSTQRRKKCDNTGIKAGTGTKMYKSTEKLPKMQKQNVIANAFQQRDEHKNNNHHTQQQSDIEND